MGHSKDKAQARALQDGVRMDEMDVPVSYDEDQVNQAIIHTREDTVLNYSMLTSINKSLHHIKYLLVIVVLLGIYFILI